MNLRFYVEREDERMGLSINVNLSDEQMDKIANLSAEKVEKAISRRFSSEEWLRGDIRRLEDSVANRDKLIVEKEFNIKSYKSALERQKEMLDKYKEKFGELQ